MSADRDEIRVELEVGCIIGIYPEERQSEQPVAARVSLWLDLEPSARTGEASFTLDYAVVARDVGTILVAGRFRLLETAALAILAALLAPFADGARPLRARVELSKPRALGSTARASVGMERTAAELIYRGDELFRGDGVVVERKSGKLAVHQTDARPSGP